jgi:hypothetical protein
VEDPAPPLRLGLQPLPALLDAAGRPGLRVAEDVRMPPNELLVHAPRDVLEVPMALLRQEQGEKVDLEEEIAELVEQLAVVAGLGGVGDLVRLLDGVRDDRTCGLLAVPRALPAKPLGQRLELEQRLAQRGGLQRD